MFLALFYDNFLFKKMKFQKIPREPITDLLQTKFNLSAIPLTYNLANFLAKFQTKSRIQNPKKSVSMLFREDNTQPSSIWNDRLLFTKASKPKLKAWMYASSALIISATYDHPDEFFGNCWSGPNLSGSLKVVKTSHIVLRTTVSSETKVD